MFPSSKNSGPTFLIHKLPFVWRLRQGNPVASYGFGDRKVSLMDSVNGTMLRQFEPINHYVTALEFSPDGKRLLTTGVDGMLRLWRTESLEEVLQFRVGGWTHAAFSPDGQSIAVGGRDGVWVLRARDATNLMKLSVEQLQAVPCTADAR